MRFEDIENSPAAEGVSVWSLPAGNAQAGGDWCDVVHVSDDVVAMIVGDVSGHGKAVAVTMVALQACVLRALARTHDPAEILAVANEFAYTYRNGVIATATIAFLNRRQHTLTFANAGHPPPLLLSANGDAFLEHPPADIPLGVYLRYSAANYIVALPGEAMIVLYTDGVTEHGRDPIRGERELVRAARLVYDRHDGDDALTIARQIFQTGSGLDDAAVMVVRAVGREI